MTRWTLSIVIDVSIVHAVILDLSMLSQSVRGNGANEAQPANDAGPRQVRMYASSL